ncbi:MAG: YeeE/YedE thiosulfate transporter family protein [Candidatus Rokuibacteriota bacterium]
MPAWAVIAALIALLVLVMIRGRGVMRPQGAWPWPGTGLALGGIGVLAWMTGSFAGWTWGLSITGPSRSLVESTVLGLPGAADWGTAMVVGVPVGTWLSARAQGPVAWRRPAWPEMGRRFGGGLLMGLGGTLAAGCNIGNALTGLSVLAINSVIATAAIVGGIAVTAAGIARVAAGLEVVRDKP